MGSVAGVSDLVTIDDALEAILAQAHPLESERLPLLEAHGRVLAQTAVATTDLPPFPPPQLPRVHRTTETV